MKAARNMKDIMKAGTRADPLHSLLNQALADMIDLRLAAKQAHWNVRGGNFIALHELFDRVSAEVSEYADMLAERVGQLDGVAHGTLQDVADRSQLKPYPASIRKSAEHVMALSAMMEAVSENLRRNVGKAEDAGDPVTADILTEASRGLDKLRWFVESHRDS